jgi:hypothetical protein
MWESYCLARSLALVLSSAGFRVVRSLELVPKIKMYIGNGYVIKMYVGLAELWATEGLEHDQVNIDWNEYEK